MANLSVPFLDLVTPHRQLEEELLQIMRQALHTAGFIGGPMVQQFETSFAAFCDVPHCIGVGSGTDALRFALTAAGVGPGDAVVTVPNTFIATTEAISQAGASIEFVDIDERTSTMDPTQLAGFFASQCDTDTEGNAISRRSGNRVAAILPVHLYGQMADMDPILELAESYHCAVIEDACQAHGAEYYSRRQQRWFKAGSMGAAGAFSFYPGKNLGACGEAGAITTRFDGLARTTRMLRDHGQATKYYHDMEGYNGRLDAIQAGFLSVKLAHLAEWNQQRRAAAARYRELFAGMEGVMLQHEPEWARSVYHLFVARTAGRDQLMKQLGEQGIGTGIHYPIPLHLQKAYAELGYARGDFPVAERVAPEIVSLPMFPGLTEEQQQTVVTAVRHFLKQYAPEGQEAVADAR